MMKVDGYTKKRAAEEGVDELRVRKYMNKKG